MSWVYFLGNMGCYIVLFCVSMQRQYSREVEARLKSDACHVLLPEEKVELAFKCGRDFFVLTSHRVLSIDVQGMSGKKVEYRTILWPAIAAFSSESLTVTSAGVCLA